MAHVSAAERRPQLIRAAIAVMRRDGVAAASTRAIAAELGIAQATVHYVYGAKDELYRAVIEQLTADIAEQVRAIDIPAGPDFHAIIGAFAQRLWRTVVEQPHVHQLIAELFVMGLRSPSLRPTIAAYQRRLDGVFEDAFREAAAYAGMTLAHPVEEVARFFFAGLDGLILQRLARPDDLADERSLLQIVAATTALAEGRLPLTGSR
ncbi:TetR/AcrR family transcriptional regulator [Nonomuraea rubra]|uniref:AcrR family transcriptional regulator n=1 Tax=Nonomuraea rubra TaxID=46180 RepID=A0A7X0U3F6_9ACTN|nr:TetR/AcrR family transcriptional regulator [Nonomuraea rubra]MBB6553410.1 AcrR family transcriptional regulator [Nonomuraea rubra]